MVDILAAPQQSKTDASLRTLAAISVGALGQPFPSVRAADAVSVPEGAVGRRLYRAWVRAYGFRRRVRPDPGADRLSRRPYRRPKSPADRAHRRRRGADHARHASELRIADRLAALLGLANSVYHPCDYAILSTHMDEARMGRAFSIHTFAGFLGGAVAPAIMAALVASVGGLGALIVAGAVGPAGGAGLIVVGIPDASSADRKAMALPRRSKASSRRRSSC